MAEGGGKKKSSWLWYVLAGLGVVAIVGGYMVRESFKRYAQKSKTSEARMFVKKIYDGARAYWDEASLADPTSLTAAAPQLPPSVGPTPALGSCCEGGDECAPNMAQWEEPGWVALRFAIEDPHRYSYEFRSAPPNEVGDVTFEALAFGDLDCDGDYSTFRLQGTANPETGVAAAPMDVERIKELE